ncbi:MAG: DUF948 domain-containing protein [Armatimonadota bacterium]
MIGLLVTLTVLVSVTLITLVVGLVLHFRRLNSAVRELETTLRVARDEIVPLVEDTRRVLRHTNELVLGARAQVDRVGHVVESVENLVEGKTIVGAAERAVSSSRTTLISVLQGMKEGLKTLRGAAKQSKEESDDE